MKFERVIRRKVRRKGNGVDVASDINATFAINASEGRSRTRTHSRQEARADTDPGKEVKEDE